MSSLFGGNAVTTRPNTTAQNFAQNAETNVSRTPATAQGAAGSNINLNRYSNTFKSSAFTHTQYEPPFKNPTPAAKIILESQGTSIEDYGRRQPGSNLYPQAPRSAKPTQYETEGLKQSDPQKVVRETVTADNCACCYNRNVLDTKYHNRKNAKDQAIAEERDNLNRL